MLFHSLEDSDFCCEPRLTYIMMANGMMTSFKSAHVHPMMMSHILKRVPFSAGLVRTAVSLTFDQTPEVEFRQFRSEGLVSGKIHSGFTSGSEKFFTY